MKNVQKSFNSNRFIDWLFYLTSVHIANVVFSMNLRTREAHIYKNNNKLPPRMRSVSQWSMRQVKKSAYILMMMNETTENMHESCGIHTRTHIHLESIKPVRMKQKIWTKIKHTFTYIYTNEYKMQHLLSVCIIVSMQHFDFGWQTTNANNNDR